MMLGLLPPNSRVTLFTLSAAAFCTIFPISVDPVKATYGSNERTHYNLLVILRKYWLKTNSKSRVDTQESIRRISFFI
jgi:hypothetical protein